MYPGRTEVWKTSRKAFYYTRGDCEAHAILLAEWLIEKGEDARVALGDYDGGGHAWVVLFKDGKEFILEATQKNWPARIKHYPLARLLPKYHPSYMFNRTTFWVNTGSNKVTQYDGYHWKEASRFALH